MFQCFKYDIRYMIKNKHDTFNEEKKKSSKFRYIYMCDRNWKNNTLYM